MAVPAEVTCQDLSGVYNLNRGLSDNTLQTLKMEGINFILRQAISRSGIEMTLKQYKSDDGLEHIDQFQVSSTGSKNDEQRVLNWDFIETHNWIFGKVRGKNRYVKLDAVEDEWLREGWEDANVEGEVIESYVESVTDTWTARQVWGFAVIDGVRRHVRRILSQKPGWNPERIRMVYDWKEKLSS